MGISGIVKKNILNVLTFKDVSNGFTVTAARKWKREVLNTYLSDKKYSFAEKRWAVKRGFLPEQVEGLQLNKENFKDTVSARDYAYLFPLNDIYSKWIADKVTINTVFKPYRSKMPQCYYQISKRYADTMIIPLFDLEAGDTFEDIFEKIKENEIVDYVIDETEETGVIEFKNQLFYLNGVNCSAEDIQKKFEKKKNDIVLFEHIELAEEFSGGIINLIIFNEQGDNPVIGDSYVAFEKENAKNATVYAEINSANGEISNSVIIKKGKRIPQAVNPNTGKELPQIIPYWNEIKETVDSMCRFVPQLEFFGLQIGIVENGFKILQILNNPEYPKSVPFSKETSDYLKYKVEQKKEAYRGIGTKLNRGWDKIVLKIRSTYAKALFPKGILPYLTVKFPKEIKKDFLTNKDTSLKEKIWALKHGFVSYRIHQYGINDGNVNEFISDFEYRWLRHINPKYRVWMEDKITVKYVCSEYNHCFPEYYYHISLKNGKNKIVPMMDCPEKYTNTYEDIFNLVKDKGSLALKPDEGSHGDGFYKFTYANEKYYLNHEEAQKEDVLKILQDVKNQYLITEYIDMHPVIKNIYSGAVNTIRMIVFKKDGKNPQIGNAYMRFGSKRTGAVDNMGAGGMFAKIDIETGRFYDAKIIEANEIKSCPYHPDTNVKIEGYLPNWEKVKADVLSVARNIPQLEYFGFDLAITPEGLKFPEINRFPDYPAIEKLSPKTMDYLLYKLEQKKISYGSKDFRGGSIIKLPKR